MKTASVERRDQTVEIAAADEFFFLSLLLLQPRQFLSPQSMTGNVFPRAESKRMRRKPRNIDARRWDGRMAELRTNVIGCGEKCKEIRFEKNKALKRSFPHLSHAEQQQGRRGGRDEAHCWLFRAQGTWKRREG